MVPYPNKKNFRLAWLILIPCLIACLIVAYKFILPTKKQFIPIVSGNSQKLTPIIKEHPVQPITVQAIVNTNTIYHRPALKKYNKYRFVLITEKGLQKNSIIDNNNVTNSDRPIAKANNIALLDSFYQSIAKQPITFRIQPQQDTVLNLPEGTVISVPANTWIYTNGHPVTEPVVFSVTEFYDKGSMICNRLSTMSNGEPLVTGGMLHLTAKDASGNEIAIKQNSSIDIQMPYKNRDEKMQLFLPKKVDSVTSLKNDNANFQTLNTLNWFGIGQSQTRMPVPMAYVIDWTELPQHFSSLINISFENSTSKFLIDRDCELTNEEVKKELEKRVSGKIKVKRAWRHPIRLFTKAEPVTIGERVSITLAKAKRFKLINAQEEQESLKQFKIDLKNFYNDSVQLAAMAQLQNQYGFKISSLGYINCDHFMNDSRQKVYYSINGTDTSETAFIHYLIFHSINSILSPSWDNSSSFRNIPVGEKVTIVSVSVKNNQTVAAFKTFTTEKSSQISLNYQPTEPAAFKKELQNFLDDFKQ